MGVQEEGVKKKIKNTRFGVQLPININQLRYRQRFDLILAIPAEEDTTPNECKQLLQEILVEWFNEIRRHSPEKIYILPWFDDEKKILISLAEIPTNPIERAAYFPKITTPTKPLFKTFTRVRLGSNMDISQYVTKNLLSPINDWYNENGCALYRKSLDNSAHPTFVGFLAYSSSFVNPETVKKLINEELLEMNSRMHGKIGVKLSNLPKNIIPPHYKNDTRSWLNVPHRVIQLEADISDMMAAKKALYKIFNVEEKKDKPKM